MGVKGCSLFFVSTLFVILSLFTIVIALSIVCYNKTKKLDIVLKSCQEYANFVDVESDKLNEINSIGYNVEKVINQRFR